MIDSDIGDFDEAVKDAKERFDVGEIYHEQKPYDEITMTVYDAQGNFVIKNETLKSSKKEPKYQWVPNSGV